MKVSIVGYSQPGQMGAYLACAGRKIGIDCKLIDLGEAETKSRVVQKYHWYFRGKRPAYLSGFAERLVALCARDAPAVLITTGGRVPLERHHISGIRSLGIKVINYSTDDPWNQLLYASWFVRSLPEYDAIFTPRRSNIGDFQKVGVRNVFVLPFGYDPDIHQPWRGAVPDAQRSDVLFVGGGDEDRLPFIEALIASGKRPALYGRYWGDFAQTRSYARGTADQHDIRIASACTSISLCMVRRANRDGHVMRSFEAAAIGGCVLAEDTPDHREMFGSDGAVAYFSDVDGLVRKSDWLLAHPECREQMSVKLRDRVAGRKDTYADRLSNMLSTVSKIF
jgi:spore maturation protein CgeB